MTDTRELIIREFMKEYAEREDGAVTVKGLCASVPVARTTFYQKPREIATAITRGNSFFVLSYSNRIKKTRKGR